MHPCTTWAAAGEQNRVGAEQIEGARERWRMVDRKGLSPEEGCPHHAHRFSSKQGKQRKQKPTRGAGGLPARQRLTILHSQAPPAASARTHCTASVCKAARLLGWVACMQHRRGTASSPLSAWLPTTTKLLPTRCGTVGWQLVYQLAPAGARHLQGRYLRA